MSDTQKTKSELIAELNELINEVRVALIGPIRQELLSGISNDEQFRIP